MGYQDPKLGQARSDGSLSVHAPASDQPVLSARDVVAIFDCAFPALRGDEARLASLKHDVVTAANEGRVGEALHHALTGAASLRRV